MLEGKSPFANTNQKLVFEKILAADYSCARLHSAEVRDEQHGRTNF